MGDTHVGLQARLMSQALRKITGNLNKSRTIVVFINQLREKIGVMFGSPETTPGGRALKFYSSVRLDIRRIESLKDGAEIVGNRARVKVVKNKVAPGSFKQAEFDIMYGKGISREGSLLDIGVDLGIVKKSGAWFTYEGEQLGQGRENVKTFLAENVDMMFEISEKVRKESGIDDVLEEEPDVDVIDLLGAPPERARTPISTDVGAAPTGAVIVRTGTCSRAVPVLSRHRVAWPSRQPAKTARAMATPPATVANPRTSGRSAVGGMRARGRRSARGRSTSGRRGWPSASVALP